LGAAKTKEEILDLEKAESQSKLQAIMEWINSMKTELEAAKKREESTNLENAKIGLKLWAVMERIAS
jgi:hypothetical protein